MAVPQNGKHLRIIGSISKFAGALVGTAVVASKRIIGSATPPNKGHRTRLKKAPTPRKKPIRRKAKDIIDKDKVLSQSQDGPVSETVQKRRLKNKNLSHSCQISLQGVQNSNGRQL